MEAKQSNQKQLSASIQSDPSASDSNAVLLNSNNMKIENFTFIDIPQDEIDILTQLAARYHGKKKSR